MSKQLADYFGVSVEDLLDDKREIPPRNRWSGPGKEGEMGASEAGEGRAKSAVIAYDEGSRSDPSGEPASPADRLIAAASALGTLGAKAKFAALTADDQEALRSHGVVVQESIEQLAAPLPPRLRSRS